VNGFFLAKKETREQNINEMFTLPFSGVRPQTIEVNVLRPITLSQAQILQRNEEAVRVNITESIFSGFFSRPITNQMFEHPHFELLRNRARFPLIRLLPLDITIFSDGSYSGVLNIHEYRGSITGLRAILPIEYGMSEDFFLPPDIQFTAQESFEERDLTQGNPRVMIVDFDAGIGLRQNDVDLITTILTVYLQEEFEVISLADVDRIIQEQGFQRETLTVQQMEIVDSILNLSKIITGYVQLRDRRYQFLAQVLDAETNFTITSVEEIGDRGEAFRRVALSLAQNLMAEIKRLEIPMP